MAWTLALASLSIAVFTATDVFLFYVVFEATLIPAYFLIGGFGRSGRGRAATKFLIYQLAWRASHVVFGDRLVRQAG